VNSGSYDGNSQFNVDDIISSGAVLIASIMPTVNSWSDISPAFSKSVAGYLENTFTSKGVTVWLRYGHEVNWYTTASASPKYPQGSKSSRHTRSPISCYVCPPALPEFRCDVVSVTEKRTEWNEPRICVVELKLMAQQTTIPDLSPRGRI
jgi:hypothetical protein